MPITPTLALIALPLSGLPQVAQSPAYELQDFAFENIVGGAVSPNFVAHVAVGELQTVTEMTSPGFQVEAGFLSAHDPDPGQAPVIFDTSPFSGPREGGTTLTLTGTNFTQFGGAPSTQVLVNGQPATGLIFVSDNELQCQTPPGEMGLTDIVIQNIFGSASASNAFVYTPAVLATATIPVGQKHTVRNFGAVGAICATYWSLTTTSIPLPDLGTVLIGPGQIIPLISSTAYPAPSGEFARKFKVPNDPTLSGFLLHFQSVEVTLVPAITAKLTNRDSMLIL